MAVHRLVGPIPSRLHTRVHMLACFASFQGLAADMEAGPNHTQVA